MNFPNSIVQLALLTLVFGCSNIESPPVTQNNPVNNQTITPVNNKTMEAASPELPSNLPPTKDDIISIEGQQSPITLKLYQNPIFYTYFASEDFVVEPLSSGEGEGVRFFVNYAGEKNEDAYAHIAFLNDFQKYAEVIEFINSKNGLLATNKWRVVSRTNETPYPWAKEKIVFSAEKNIVGSIYIGEENGKAFYVITHLPAEYVYGFLPNVSLILSNLQVF
jgi:hypothetical protein